MMDSSRNNFLIQALMSYPQQIVRQIQTKPDEMLTWQPAEGQWSVKEVLAHLLHCEPFFQKRLARIVAETNPALPGFGPEEATPASEDSAVVLMQALRAARQGTLKQIYHYSPNDWERPAYHQVQGATTLKDQIQNIVNHDIEHLGQIIDLCVLWERHMMKKNDLKDR